MTAGPERRTVPRTRLAEQPSARVRGLREVRLLDLAATTQPILDSQRRSA
jgi:hypothetical protein